MIIKFFKTFFKTCFSTNLDIVIDNIVSMIIICTSTAIFMSAFLLSNIAFADGIAFNNKNGVKKISFADNERVKIVLSNRDVNRVLVEGDKIQSVNGPSGLYVAKNDASGSIYINVYGEATFTIFMSTIRGHNFSLLVTPKTIAGETIILRPTSPVLLTKHFEEFEKFEVAESYQKMLVRLIKGMINNEILEDYAYREVNKSQRAKKVNKEFDLLFKDVDFCGMLDITPVAFYSDSNLLGIVAEIKNKSKKPLMLKPPCFYKPGVRAVALSHQTIAPLETSMLYQVISRAN